MSNRKLRCGIYTRKSTEEGLDQEFNSLDAQREACEAYIKSQRHEGWMLVRKRYDDGGLSGATMDRPALRSLLDDIRDRRIDVIVVYKVDRLTRALSDFAKMVEVFDEHQASFVSVTQQFNTTSSMGRLTLNVLLSFAQFEREVTAERIRDKIAASKRKGMWMGGLVPLGYDAVDKHLVVNEREAETIRQLFTLYVELGNVRAVKREADRLGLQTKQRRARNGERRGGQPFMRGHLYNLLRNPIYVGDVAHKGERHAGEHEALIDTVIWEKVQFEMKKNGIRRRGYATAKPSSFLTGLLFDGHGRRLVPSHTRKSGRHYRYYVSQDGDRDTTAKKPPWRFSAEDLERLVLDQVCTLLRDPLGLDRYLEAAGASRDVLSSVVRRQTAGAADWLAGATPGSKRDALNTILERIEACVDSIRLTVSGAGILGWLREISGDKKASGTAEKALSSFILEVPCRLRRCGNSKKLLLSDRTGVAPAVDPKLVAAVAQAHQWHDDLSQQKIRSLGELARSVGRDRSYVGRVLRLVFLAPDIVEAIAAGHQPADLTVTRLIRLEDLPLSWAEQRRLLGFES
jgi:DNA invertase Pin-like site-specific DNA recombinase